MAGARRTDQAQWSGSTSAAHNLNFAAINNLSAGKTVSLFVERMPFPVAIKPPQNIELIRGGELDRSEQWHRDGAWLRRAVATIRRTANAFIGENLMVSTRTC